MIHKFHKHKLFFGCFLFFFNLQIHLTPLWFCFLSINGLIVLRFLLFFLSRNQKRDFFLRNHPLSVSGESAEAFLMDTLS